MSARPLLFSMLALLGCSRLLPEVDRDECALDTDCPGDEVCVEGRCRLSERIFLPDADVDLDQGPLDAAPDAEAQPEAEPKPDAAPDAEVDAMVDATVTPFGPEGACFEGPGGLFRTLDGSDPNYIPAALCGPYARLWTQQDAAGVEVVYDTTGDQTPDGRLALAPRALPALGGPVLLAPSPNMAESGAINIERVDLRTGRRDYPKSTSWTQTQPARGDGVSAFIEVPPVAESQVVLLFDDDDAYSCRYEGRDQWGVALGDGWAAWFEQRRGGRLPFLVVAEWTACGGDGQRRERLLTGPVEADAQVQWTDDGPLWLQQDREARVNALWRWRFREPGAEPEPLGPIELRGNPIDLTAHGNWAAVVGYRLAAPRYVLELIRLDPLEVHTIAHNGDARRPALSGRALVWSERGNRAIWEIRHEPLPE